MKEGIIHHAWNLDYPITTEKMKSVLYEARFHKDGNYVFSGFCFSGFLGVYTTLKPKAFSISYNVRSID